MVFVLIEFRFELTKLTLSIKSFICTVGSYTKNTTIVDFGQVSIEKNIELEVTYEYV